MSVNRHLLCICIILLAALALPDGVQAEIYVYVDKNGVSHYTNAPTDSRYKKARLEELNTQPGRSISARETWQRTRRGTPQNPAKYEHYISKAALSHEVDPLLIKAIIRTESNFDPFAVSSKGAQGLVQLMPGTARSMRVGNPFDPAQNISGGARYLRELLNSYEGNLALSLAAYNAGPGNVAKNGPLPKIPETRDYVRKVIQHYRSYQQNAGAPVSLSKNIKVGKLVTVN
jgi:soluble lytic murein transglycosylase-like protein